LGDDFFVFVIVDDHLAALGSEVYSAYGFHASSVFVFYNKKRYMSIDLETERGYIV
jgi:hypothetical protein